MGSAHYDSQVADALAIVLDLAALDPIQNDLYDDEYCPLCQSSPPGGARTMTQSHHDPGCVWVRAQKWQRADG